MVLLFFNNINIISKKKFIAQSILTISPLTFHTTLLLCMNIYIYTHISVARNMGTKILLTLVVTVLKLISLPPNTKQYDKKRPKKKKALYEQGDILLDMFALFFLTLFFLNCKYVSFFFLLQ